MSSVNLTTIAIPSVFQWIMSAPTLIGKISRVFEAAQTKNWFTTAAALAALLAYLANMFGLPIDDTTLQTIQTVALAIIGFFTGKQVVNPQKVDADWKVLETSAEEKTHGQT
jgi:hypothetical protein